MLNKNHVFWAKLQLKVVKLLPITLAFIHVLSSYLNYVDVDTLFLSFLGGISFLSLLFLYISSFAFKFCNYHRMFIHYLTTTEVINWMDYVIGIPLTDVRMLLVLMILYGITCFIALFMFLNKRDLKDAR